MCSRTRNVTPILLQNEPLPDFAVSAYGFASLPSHYSIWPSFLLVTESSKHCPLRYLTPPFLYLLFWWIWSASSWQLQPNHNCAPSGLLPFSNLSSTPVASDSSYSYYKLPPNNGSLCWLSSSYRVNFLLALHSISWGTFLDLHLSFLSLFSSPENSFLTFWYVQEALKS